MMKFAWLEKMAADGLIREEALEHIYGECTELLHKTSEDYAGQVLSDFSKSQSVMKSIPGIVNALIMGTMVAAPIVGYFRKKYLDANTKAKIDIARQRVTAMYAGEDRAKAEARFNEISKFAPHLAMNEEVVKELIRRKYKTGFTDRDVQGLMSIETKLSPDPMGYANLSSYQPKYASKKEEVLGDLGEKLATMMHMVDNPEQFKSLPFFTDEVVSGLPLLKEAKSPVPLSHIMGYLAVPALMGVGIGTAQMIRGKLNERDLQKKVDESYASMMNGVHSDFLRENEPKAREAFQSLVHFAPHVAAEPIAAGTFVKRIIDYKMNVQTPDVKDLVSIETDFSARGGTSPGDAYLKALEASKFTSSVPKALGAVFGVK